MSQQYLVGWKEICAALGVDPDRWRVLEGYAKLPDEHPDRLPVRYGYPFARRSPVIKPSFLAAWWAKVWPDDDEDEDETAA